MKISTQVAELLDQLIATGLYASSREEVMEQLVCRQLDMMLQAKYWGLMRPAPAEGPRCPKCGSPRLNDISGMGQRETQCLDCDHRFPV